MKILKMERLININLDNVKVGDVFKNYPELCTVLGEKVKSGAAKTSQLKELERYIDYDKQGRKFIIKEIYQEPKEKNDNRSLNGNTAPYITDAELLLIDLMLCGDGELLLPNNALMQALKLVNHNYSKYYGYNRPLLANGLNIDLEHVNDYYNNVNSSLVGNLKTIMNRLEKKKLLFHKEVIMIKVVELASTNYNEYGNLKLYIDSNIDHNGIERTTYKPAPLQTKEALREATTDELRNILRIHRETMIQLGFNKDDKYNVLYKEGLTFKFNKIVNDRLLKELNILRSFKSHHLIFNNDHLEDERIDLLDKIEKQLIHNKVNYEVRKRIMENARNRSNDASKILIDYLDKDKDVNDKLIRRSSTSYINSYELLNTFLIDNSLTPQQAHAMFKIQPKQVEDITLELPELM
ncbi:hypothetical protein [Lysinibacillus sp. BPa_S21]|uniref:hypothetical protein n=1 Tax=Lysinibacillus sp. BPa_S21 TaxID=2932478 RepID=UPI00201255E0|nr:hypothetical protein [Lysinibacillus sp. BPa_S21]MCL1696282.1 hypothetical protein [Lysinibacillus sp. BPa_S21]